MNRNKDIQRIFEIADDSLQGVLGYHLYVISMQKTLDAEKLKPFLPENEIPHTHSWNRYYRKEDLIATMNLIFELYQSRISLIAMVNVFEVALEKFICALNTDGHQQLFNTKKLIGNGSYKTHLKWAYQVTSNCNIGDQYSINRLPITFGKIDDARRLRNLIVHNHGLFKNNYKSDPINLKGIQIQLNPNYSQSIPITISTSEVIDFSKSHIEIIHIIHNTLQKRYYNVSKAYDYRNEKKHIEWNKVLWGI